MYIVRCFLLLSAGCEKTECFLKDLIGTTFFGCEAKSGWRVQGIVDRKPYALIKYCANQNDIDLLKNAINYLYGNNAVIDVPDLSRAIQEEYLTKIVVKNIKFELEVDWHKTLSLIQNGCADDGNSIILDLFQQLNRGISHNE